MEDAVGPLDPFPSSLTREEEDVLDQQLKDLVSNNIMADVVKGVFQAKNSSQLKKLVPIPLQPNLFPLFGELEGVMTSQMNTTSLIQKWKKVLDSSDAKRFDSLSWLNGVKIPTLKVHVSCTDTVKTDEILAKRLLKTKESVLYEALSTKKKELTALMTTQRGLVEKGQAIWTSVRDLGLQEEGPHANKILSDRCYIWLAMVRALSSIVAANNLKKVLATNQKEAIKKKAAVGATDLNSPNGQKKLQQMINEAVRRNSQSRKDKKMGRKSGPKSKKDRGGSTPPNKKKAKKPKGNAENKVTKNRKRKNTSGDGKAGKKQKKL